jgi:hypothetical protein
MDKRQKELLIDVARELDLDFDEILEDRLFERTNRHGIYSNGQQFTNISKFKEVLELELAGDAIRDLIRREISKSGDGFYSLFGRNYDENL